jgi:hypothetical protein
MRRLFYLFFFALLFFTIAGFRNSYADDYRMEKKLGVYLSFLGDPFPSFGGLNIAYNATNYLRLTGGMGYYASPCNTITSLGIGVKALLPHEDFSPVVGLTLSYSFWSWSSNSSCVSSFDYGNHTNTLAFVYTNVGFDYQSKGGFNIGVGVILPFVNAYGWLPGLNIGKFF